MIKKILLIIIFLNIFFLLWPIQVLAANIPPLSSCDPKRIADGSDQCVDATGVPAGYSCLQDRTITSTVVYTCQRDVIGQVQPPQAIKALGAGDIGISKFLNNLITLIYILAVIVFVLMLLWGAFEWLSSGGDKEALGRARDRIRNAIIGIILFAITFAILNVIGVFTGFTFFT